jgi:hypothetical protein
MLLEMVAKFYAEERTARLGGEDGEWDIFEFKGAVIGENTRVDVLAGSAQPHSKAGRIALMESLLTLFIQNGMPMSRRDLSVYLKDMGVGGFEHLTAKLTEDESQVHWENRLMSSGATQGKPLPINSYDDDEAHVAGHQSFQKTARYRNLDPRIQQIFEQHVQMHRDRVMAQEQAQQQQEIEHAAILAEVTKPPTTSNSNGSKSSASS